MNLDFIKKNKIFVIISSILLVLILVLIIVFFTLKDDKIKEIKTNPTFNLVGLEYITLKQGDNYIEPGYYAYDEYKNLANSDVLIYGDVDISTIGNYVITYQYRDIILQRRVEVVENNNQKARLELKGKIHIQLYQNDNYKEPGYEAYNANGDDLTNQVLITGDVDTTKVGTYTLIYQLKLDDKTLEQKRIVEVLEKDDSNDNIQTPINDPLKIEITVDETTPTNQSINVSINVTGDNFSYLVFPNDVTTKSQIATYTILKNGTYSFLVYDKNQKVIKKEITISNIDTTKPNGACQATLEQESTEIKVLFASEKIAKYVYLDNQKELKSTTAISYKYPAKTSSNIYVKMYDQAGNESLFKCSIIDNTYYPPITPVNQDEKTVFISETASLKVYITKKNDYYLTRVWARNPYQQLNKFDSPEYGKNLYRPSTLLSKAISKYNLQNKLVVGFNASGFYLKDTFDASSVDKYSSYNKTSVGTLVITDGKVIRNAYNKAYKTWFVAGVDSNNKLRIFTDKKASTTSEINAKKTWSQSVINSGIRNTFTFASPLIENGVKSLITTNMPSYSSKKDRQAICQVNDNNFVLITGKNLTRNNLINIMLSLNCQTGTNLDGGGSIALLYKDKNSTTLKKVIGDSRSLTEVGYFTE